MYHNVNDRIWLTDANHLKPGQTKGNRLSDELTLEVLKQIPADVVLKDQEIFEVTKKEPSRLEVETPSRPHRPQSLEDWAKWPSRLEVETPSRPQSLEDWAKWLAALHLKHPCEGINTLAQHVSQAQVFEFGEVSEAKLNRENARALELHNKGFLNLPYRCVIYRYTGELCGRVAIIALQDGPVLQYGGLPGTTDHLVWPLSLMLATKGTKLRVEEPSRKLQAKRAAHNKPRLPRVTYVDAEHYYQAMRNSETKGTHASPVPHLRRGHIRHWKERQIWIRDMLVNCKSISELEHRERYQIKGVFV
jgi:hypothetical protein